MGNIEFSYTCSMCGYSELVAFSVKPEDADRAEEIAKDGTTISCRKCGHIHKVFENPEAIRKAALS